MIRLIALAAALAAPVVFAAPSACEPGPRVLLEAHLAQAGAWQQWELLGADILGRMRQADGRPLATVQDFFMDPLRLTGDAVDDVPLSWVPPVGSASPPVAAEDRLDEIRLHLDRALAAVSDGEAAALTRLLPRLLDRTSNGSDLAAFEDGPVLADIARQVDPAGLQRIAGLLTGLADPALAAALVAAYAGRNPIDPPAWLAPAVSGSILYAAETPHGPTIVGGPGPNRYFGPARLIIDLGGDDEYLLPPVTPAPQTGTVTKPEAGNRGAAVRAIIDLIGNDRYTTLADGGPAGAVLGASLIVDHAGDDEYIGGRIALGAAVAGVGVLIDHAGNDHYTAGELTQGAALAGVGFLIDTAGDDVYTAAKFAQGFGGALGTGTLRDEGGDDRYFAGHKHPSSYGVPGRYQAFSQGVGMGFRGTVAGGIGLLHDLAGDDEYRAGNFAQGTGYFLGLGRLLDDSGNDRYFGGRYAQGAAAHLGIGVLYDRAGNDRYAATTSASQGGAWDRSLVALIDCGGDDDYRANDFALGAAAHNAIAVFVDLAGHDRYAAVRHAAGYAPGPGDPDAGDGPGDLAVFIDHGAGTGERDGQSTVNGQQRQGQKP